MPECLRFFVGFWHEVQLDLDFEFSPSGLLDFEGRLFDCADALRVCLVQFELHFLQPVRDVLAVDALDEDAP